MSEAATLTGATPARTLTPRLALPALAALLAACALASMAVGAFYVAPADVLAVVAHRLHLRGAPDVSPQAAAVVWAVRAPRTLLAAGVGAALGASGSVMQGVFRNPLVDPGLFGVSSGAGLGAVAAIVLGARIAGGLPPALAPYATQAAAFAGALAATLLWLRLARTGGRGGPAAQLLTGVAINAAAASLMGFLISSANDAQLHTITFWNLGSVGGATWPLLAALALTLAPSLALLPRLARPLDALLLGEAEAGHLGVSVETTKKAAVVLVALAVGASVAVAGVVWFVGLVVPHLARLLLGPGHRRLLPGAALLGAALVVLADLAARTLVAPAELPLGVVTGAIGAPFFLALLAREQRGLAP